MKLYGSFTSPFVRHCRIALLQYQQAFEFIPTDYGQSAALNPTQRVPFADVETMRLHDSAAILKYIREHNGEAFFNDLADHDLFCLANSLLDTSINVFLLGKDGVTTESSAYLSRQQSRIEATLQELEQRDWSAVDSTQLSDGQIRLACYLSWAAFRHLLALDSYPNLRAFLRNVDQQPHFANTHPALA